MTGHYYQDGHTWGNAIAVERLLLRDLDTFFDGLFTGLLSIEGRPETSGTLLVHLGSRRNTIDSHEEQLFGLDFSKQMFNVIEYANEHLFLTKAEGHIFACILVGTVVNDTIHVKLGR
jgi:hypothetical protein